MEFSNQEPNNSDFEVADLVTCTFGMVIPMIYFLVSKEGHRELYPLSSKSSSLSQFAECLELQNHNHKVVLRIVAGYLLPNLSECGKIYGFTVFGLFLKVTKSTTTPFQYLFFNWHWGEFELQEINITLSSFEYISTLSLLNT